MLSRKRFTLSSTPATAATVAPPSQQAPIRYDAPPSRPFAQLGNGPPPSPSSSSRAPLSYSESPTAIPPPLGAPQAQALGAAEGPALERKELHRSLDSIQALLAALNEYRELNVLLAKAEKKLGKACKDISVIKGVADAPSKTLAQAAALYEQLSDVSSKFSKGVQKDYETLNDGMGKFFKRVAKEERAHDDYVERLDREVKKAGAAYEKKAKKKDRDVGIAHEHYIHLLTTLGAQIASSKTAHVFSLSTLHLNATHQIGATLSRSAADEFTRSCEAVRRVGPGIGRLHEWANFCVVGTVSAQPADLPDYDKEVEEYDQRTVRSKASSEDQSTRATLRSLASLNGDDEKTIRYSSTQRPPLPSPPDMSGSSRAPLPALDARGQERASPQTQQQLLDQATEMMRQAFAAAPQQQAQQQQQPRQAPAPQQQQPPSPARRPDPPKQTVSFAERDPSIIGRQEPSEDSYIEGSPSSLPDSLVAGNGAGGRASPRSPPEPRILSPAARHPGSTTGSLASTISDESLRTPHDVSPLPTRRSPPPILRDGPMSKQWGGGGEPQPFPEASWEDADLDAEIEQLKSAGRAGRVERSMSVSSVSSQRSFVAEMRERYTEKIKQAVPPSSPPSEMPRSSRRVSDLAFRYNPVNDAPPPSSSSGSIRPAPTRSSTQPSIDSEWMPPPRGRYVAQHGSIASNSSYGSGSYVSRNALQREREGFSSVKMNAPLDEIQAYARRSFDSLPDRAAGRAI